MISCSDSTNYVSCCQSCQQRISAVYQCMVYAVTCCSMSVNDHIQHVGHKRHYIVCTISSTHLRCSSYYYFYWLLCAYAVTTAGTESGAVQGGGLLMSRADLSAALVRVSKHKVYTHINRASYAYIQHVEYDNKSTSYHMHTCNM
jgi:hypothetical protein